MALFGFSTFALMSQLKFSQFSEYEGLVLSARSRAAAATRKLSLVPDGQTSRRIRREQATSTARRELSIMKMVNPKSREWGTRRVPAHPIML